MKKRIQIQTDCEPSGRQASIQLTHPKTVKLKADVDGWAIPGHMLLRKACDPGITLGLPQEGKTTYVGLPQGAEGNLLVIGGNGSGKSSGVAMPTLETWRGPICATDIKGELSARYGDLYRRGLVSRRYIVVNPMDPAGPSYDPFWWLARDAGENLAHNALQMAATLLPLSPGEKDKFWDSSEQAVFAAMAVYSVRHGLSFSEMTAYLLGQSLPDLCKELWTDGDSTVRFLLGKMHAMKKQTLACIERGFRNRLMGSAADPRISHFFRGRRETANWFSWDELAEHNIFLCIPPDKLETWGWAVNLMYAQLIRHLESRPEKYNPQGRQIPQTLVLMDEFPRFGRLEPIANALATLRSKGVNFCLMAQSVAQLDLIYGKDTREVMLDNAQYKLILGAGDAETQGYLSRLIGSGIQLRNSLSVSLDADGKQTRAVSMNTGETRDFLVQPHTLAAMRDAVLLTPWGACRVEKYPPGQRVKGLGYAGNRLAGDGKFDRREPWVQGDVMLSMEQRMENAKSKLDAAQRKLRLEQRREAEEEKRTNHLRTQAVGRMVLDHFPALNSVALGSTMDQALEGLRIVDIFLDVLCAPEHGDILRRLLDEANRNYTQEAASGEKRAERDAQVPSDRSAGGRPKE